MIDGTYDVTVKSPMGAQDAVLTVKTDGSAWSGSQVGSTGTIDITDGVVDGNTLKWVSKITSPMAMTLENEATIDGDALTGSVKAGAFGSFPMTGTRKA